MSIIHFNDYRDIMHCQCTRHSLLFYWKLFALSVFAVQCFSFTSRCPNDQLLMLKVSIWCLKCRKNVQRNGYFLKMVVFESTVHQLNRTLPDFFNKYEIKVFSCIFMSRFSLQFRIRMQYFTISHNITVLSTFKIGCFHNYNLFKCVPLH